jgi:Ca-activated chloride channel homolog
MSSNALPLLPIDPVAATASEAGFGALRTERGGLPLAELAVAARVDGLVAQTEIHQTFVNAHDTPLEATYIFPLPDRTAVTRFRLEVAGRVVEGDLQERAQARHTYEKAIADGHRAAIAEEERPGVFTMRVGNLPPGERAVVSLTLVGPLPFAVTADSAGCSSGEVTFRFPLVVAPRYIPGMPLPGGNVGLGMSTDTDLVPDASRISPPVLLPGFPNPVRLSLTVTVSPSLDPGDFRSSLHTIVSEEGLAGCRLSLQPGERLDRDFVLRYRVGGPQVRTSLALQPDADGTGGTFLLTLIPPVEIHATAMGRDLVFVLDRSGSMSGWKMVAARRALARMVETLTVADRFTVYAFDDRIETPPGFDGVTLVPATDAQRYRASEYLATLDARGGTEMAQPLTQALAELHRHERADRARVLVLITDGQVGNENHILRELGRQLRGVRTFTLGIDRAVNESFLRRLAELGGGTSEVVESEERLADVMDRIHRHIGAPVLTQLRLEAPGGEVESETLVPGRLPDLFAGSPVLVSGRYRGSRLGAMVVRAVDAQSKEWATETAARMASSVEVARIWARGRVRELEDRYLVGTSDQSALEREIVSTSLRFGVLSRFTAFVAVDRSEVVNPGGEVKEVVQPVETPSGWDPRAVRAGGMLRGIPSVGALKSLGLTDRLGSAPAASPTDASASECCSLSDIPGGNTTTDFDPMESGRSFYTGQKKGRVSKRTTPAVDPASPQGRAAALLNTLKTEPTQTVAAQWQVLRAIVDDLARLVADLQTAGDSSPVCTRLAEVAARVRDAGDVQPSDAAVQAWWDMAVRGLEEWLEAQPGAEGGRRWWQFWK